MPAQANGRVSGDRLRARGRRERRTMASEDKSKAESKKCKLPDFEIKPEANLAGLRELREAVENYARRRIPSRRRIQQDAVAGLTVGVSSIPDGMAGGVLAGVNPVYGLYANVVGPIVGAVFSSTRLMVINNTSAVSLVALSVFRRKAATARSLQWSFWPD